MPIRPPLVFTTPAAAPTFSQLWTPQAEALAKRYGFTVDLIPGDGPKNPAAWRRLLAPYEAIITSWGAPRLGEEILRDNQVLKLVGHAAGSVADLVTDELYARGVRVVSANNTMARGVAEWCLTATLLGFGRAHRLLRQGAPGGPPRPLPWTGDGNNTRSLRDATIGIWGHGAIARQYLELLKPFAPARILLCSDYATDRELREQGLVPATLEEVFSQADVVLLLVGLGDKTLEKIDGSLLGLMRDEATLVNFGRGRLTRERDLVDALADGRIQAFLDVFHQEPLSPDSPLLRMPNVYLTPHIGASGMTAHYLPDVLENFDRFYRGEPLRDEITAQRAATMTSHQLASAR